jgi:putative membrane protein
MERASRLFTDEQKKQVNLAVGQAEAKTSAEIVPVVAAASGRYDRAEDVFGLWLGVVAMIVLWQFLPPTHREVGDWSGGFSAGWQVLCLAATVVVAFVVGAAVATYVGWIRKLFVPRRQMRDEVAGRARQAFVDSRVHHTAAATGLLVYVSLYERMAVLLADEAVVDALGEQALAELRDGLVAGLKGGDVAGAICKTIAAAGERLAGALPRAADDVNELPDAMVLID